MTGVDPIYVNARRVLLDALEALGAHMKSVVLVGAQGIYVHTGDIDLPVAPYTTDGDLTVDVAALHDEPTLVEAMTKAGFVGSDQPGIWIGANSIKVDLLVPETMGGGGTRGARLGVHGNRTVRIVKGIEGALVERSGHLIRSFEENDGRSFEIDVAGPAALLVAKLHKIGDRVKESTPESRRARAVENKRLHDKDALDVLRLLRLPTTDVSRGLRMLGEHRLSSSVTKEALVLLKDLFVSAEARGSQMAGRASGLRDPSEIALSCAELTRDLLAALNAPSSVAGNP